MTTTIQAIPAILAVNQARTRLALFGLLVMALLMTSGCGYTTAERVRAEVDAPPAEVALFSHCSAYGCQIVNQVSFENEEWSGISRLFDQRPSNALAEREMIPAAIAMMEHIIGPKTGTADDIAKSWMFTFVPEGQLDCIDESINTTTYLELLDKAGFIRHHDIGRIALRGNRSALVMLHNTATLIEHDSGKSYAVDSWYGANGMPAHVVPLEDWLEGWKPKS